MTITILRPRETRLFNLRLLFFSLLFFLLFARVSVYLAPNVSIRLVNFLKCSSLILFRVFHNNVRIIYLQSNEKDCESLMKNTIWCLILQYVTKIPEDDFLNRVQSHFYTDVSCCFRATRIVLEILMKWTEISTKLSYKNDAVQTRKPCTREKVPEKTINKQ